MFSFPAPVSVTPLAGVWIEIREGAARMCEYCVTPLAGVWIEIRRLDLEFRFRSVTPLAGVWIEMRQRILPASRNLRHSPRGSVD